MSRKTKWLVAIVVCLAVIAIPFAYSEWSARAAVWEKMAKIKAGKSEFLVDPDARLLESIIKDRECASKITLAFITGKKVAEERYRRLKELPNLKVIWIEYTGDADILLQNIRGMTCLEEISFHNAPVSVAGTRQLSSFPHLTRLRLNNFTNETLESIKGLSHLKLLERNYGNIDDAGLAILATLTQLESLDLVYTEKITDQGIQNLQKQLPNCKITRQ